MKRILIVVLAMCFVLSFFGCGKGKEEGKVEKPKGETVTAKMPQEMSAKVISGSGKRSMKSKFAMKGQKFRTESEMAAGSYTIVRRDLKKVWMVMPATKSYMEVEEGKQEEAPVPEEKVRGEISRKVVGSETIDGHPCTKYEVTAKVDDKTMVTHQWWATDINFPVKTAAVDGTWFVEYRDIKIGAQPDSIFELPAGYRKMSIPTVPGKGTKK
ncbi:MAG: DUF4412 domain-containing protein [Deltaproteobacteria bacterium]|nr:DUF4412 domain-containing protein [Deltaproteobacteria bacterium]